MRMYLFRCKVFRDATAAREVGRCMAVDREWRLHWWDKERFLSVLGECAATGNPEASYILGLVTSEAQILSYRIASCSVVHALTNPTATILTFSSFGRRKSATGGERRAGSGTSTAP